MTRFVRASKFAPASRDYLQSAIDLNELLISNAPSTFHIIAETNTVEPLIPFGSMVLVDRSEVVMHNDIVMAVVDGEHVLRQYLFENGKGWLKPTNNRTKARPIEVTSEVELCGVVMVCIIKPRDYVRAR